MTDQLYTHTHTHQEGVGDRSMRVKPAKETDIKPKPMNVESGQCTQYRFSVSFFDDNR